MLGLRLLIALSYCRTDWTYWTWSMWGWRYRQDLQYLVSLGGFQSPLQQDPSRIRIYGEDVRPLEDCPGQAHSRGSDTSPRNPENPASSTSQNPRSEFCATDPGLYPVPQTLNHEFQTLSPKPYLAILNSKSLHLGLNP